MSDTNKVPLSSLKSGDKFIAEGTVTGTYYDGSVAFILEGAAGRNISVTGTMVTKIIPPKTTVEVGDVFRQLSNGDERKILAIHDKGLWLEHSIYGLMTIFCRDRGRFYLDDKNYEFIRNEPVE